MLKKPTLNGVLSGFRKNIKDLETVISNDAQQVETNNETINSLQNTNAELDTEIKTATKVKDNLSKLIGDED